MTDDNNYYRRNLPHYQPSNACYFVTFRLVNTIPNDLLETLIQERLQEEQKIRGSVSGNQQQEDLYRLRKKYFGRFDDWLDGCIQGKRWLDDERVRSIIRNEMHRLNQLRYRMIAYCIMLNHVHLVVDLANIEQGTPSDHKGTTQCYPLSDILRLLKGRTARACNQVLGREGTFWQQESYDHVVRGQHELGRIIRYCLENPVKAGLVRDWREWGGSYVAPQFGERS